MGENNGAHRNPFCTYWLSRKRALCVSFRCVLGGISRFFFHFGLQLLHLGHRFQFKPCSFEFRISPQTFGEILDLQISLTCHKE